MSPRKRPPLDLVTQLQIAPAVFLGAAAGVYTVWGVFGLALLGAATIIALGELVCQAIARKPEDG